MRCGRPSGGILGSACALALTSALTLTGCGAGPAPVTLVVAGNVTTTLDDEIAAFESEHPNVHVELIDMGEPADTGAVSSDRAHDLYAGYMATGTSRVDVYEIDVVWVAEFAAAGWLLPLDDAFPPAERAEFEPAAVAACTYAGRVWAFPEFTDFGLLYYRTDVFGDGTPPETWDDLAGAEGRAGRAGAPAAVYGYQGERYEGLTCNFWEALWGAGGTFADADGAVHVNSDEAVEGLTRLVGVARDARLAPPEAVTWHEADGERAFRAGRLAALRAWPSAWRTVQDAGAGSVVAGRVGVGFPLHSAGRRSYSALGGWQVAVASDTPSPREAVELARFLCSERAQKARALSRGFIPTRPHLLDDPEVRAANPHFALFEKYRDAIRPRPVLPAYREISRVLSLHVHRALVGEETPREALDMAAAQIEPLAAPQSVPRSAAPGAASGSGSGAAPSPASGSGGER